MPVAREMGLHAGGLPRDWRHGFSNYDDDRYILTNAHVQAGLAWSTVAWAFTSLEEANWHPLTWLSHALDCQLFQLNPRGHHYTSLLLHAANVVLPFLCWCGSRDPRAEA